MAADAPSRPGLADRIVDLTSVAIATLVTVTQIFRPSPRDAVLFALVTAALSVDLARTPAVAPPSHPTTRRPAVPPGTWCAVGALGLVLAVAPRRSVLDAAVLVAVGAAAALAAWAGGTSSVAAPWPPARARAARAWAVVTLVLCVWELVAFVLGLGHAPGTTPPAVSDVLDPWLDHPGPRVLFVVAWLAGLGYLLRRGRR